jgi:hypothetical protein
MPEDAVGVISLVDESPVRIDESDPADAAAILV